MRVWIAVGLLCLSLRAASQPPAPSGTDAASEPQERSQQAEAQASADHQISSPLPASIANRPPVDLQPRSHEKEEKARDYTSHEWWLVYLTALLCLFTLGLAFFTLRLWGATNTITLDANRSSERQLRAYIGPSSRVIFGLDGTEPVRLVVKMKNYGQTPARNVKAGLFVSFGDSSEPESGRPIDVPQTAIDQRSAATMFPGEEVTHAIDTKTLLRPDQIERIEAGTLTLCAWGEITYDDGFDPSRMTQFRSIVGRTALQKHPSIASGWALTVCEKGNDWS